MDTIKIADIKIGDRRREDFGDIEALAKSIAEYGLLAPPVLTDDGTLIAGQRRIEAMKRLGWTETPYINKGDLTAERLREIELEENIRRKDFTEYEISKNMVDLAEVVGKRLVEQSEFCPKLGQNPEGGRPSKPNGIRMIANEVGVPRSTISDARAHVAAVEAYPVLESVPKMKAISIAKQANTLPEEQRRPFTEEQAAQIRDDLHKLSQDADTAKMFIKALSAIRVVEITRENVEAWIRFERMNRDDIDEAHGDIRESIARFQALDQILIDLCTPRIVR